MVDKTRDDEEKKMDDKFILMGLDDENSKNVAEVLKSEKAKKILDFLGDRKEASEKDIAEGLNMPINTVEYNLKKLVKSGLVDKSKNFFWSVKGKKIPMYKLAKKHIIIGTKKPNINYLKSILPAILIAAVLIALLLMFAFPQTPPDSERGIWEGGLKKFSSMSELKDYLEESAESGVSVFGEREEDGIVSATGIAESTPTDSAQAAQKASEYSETNIQVEGVDEADIVKNDGRYIYVVSSNKVIIVDAYPAENMKVLSEIEFDKPVIEIFVNDNNLIVFESFYGIDKSLIYVYDISDRENPVKEQEIESDGYYQNSRMIGDYVYVITNKYVNINNPEPPVYLVDGTREEISVRDIYYWDYPHTNYVFTSVLALNIDNGEFDSKVYLTGGSGTVYVSVDSIYLTNQKRISYENYLESYVGDVIYELSLPEDKQDEIGEIVDSNKKAYEKMNEINRIVYDYSLSLRGSEKADFDEKLNDLNEKFEISISKKSEITLVHKISIEKDKINYLGVGEVPGRVLNQFSMDENNGYFRIATTTGSSWSDTSLNHLYVLDEDLEIVGSVEDLAKGEQIYSVRFMGNKAYMVTFKRVDPLFVIDLENPKNPEVLGYLKITGFSNYLHPYNENILIGVGMEASEEGRVQGVKIGLFDVSDFENPREIDKYIVEGDYSYTEVQYDHKAFLFDKQRNLLVLPVSYSYYASNRGDYENWQGAFIFYINENGLTKRGQITHYEPEEDDRGYYYWYPGVRRSLYMDDVLYTISGSKIKANRLIDLSDIKEVVYADLKSDDRIFYAEAKSY